ncbi:type II toxin-antitoxin system VapB family antitoxin [Chamaesiphon polymorphus]|uniref:DUF2281 domain-containing protein n=1 Tax=Chamaesiphon polymorphus CCALA 037 TaxID=2107692 RepID=A0A2T1GJP6_9CYAN|nr:DUF2281 domain-containing protein [Chamaesiphon polymorphus]PSB58037.1 hypothetical protein C7B77_06135 [Chamaesiphon polymorphus CCALA 037]
MEQALLEQIQRLPESVQQEALQYLEDLVAKHTRSTETHTKISRKDAFGIWKGQVWMADDFNAPLEDLQEYM